MKTPMFERVREPISVRPGPGVAAILWLAVAVATCAPQVVRAEVLPMLPAGEFYVLVQERIEESIRAVEKAARDEEAVAAQEMAQAQAVFEQEKSLVTIQQKEIETLKAKIDAAKTAKDEASKLELERQKKIVEVELKLLEKRREMREAELAFARAQKEAGQSAAAACERELDLRTRRAALQALREKGTATIAEIRTEAAKARETERAVLQSQRNAAGKREEAAKRLGELLGRRIEVLEAQAALLVVRG